MRTSQIQRAARLATILFALVASAPQVQAGTAGPAAALFDRIRDRLGLMQPVAAWKMARDVAVEDLAREKVVIQASMDAAKVVGIDGPSARAFFEAQISAAKEIQVCWISRWTKGTATTPQSVPDLVNDIRPQLIKLGASILDSAAYVLRENQNLRFTPALESIFVATVNVDCLSDDAKRKIYRALGALRLVK